jgi:hypothetical protein
MQMSSARIVASAVLALIVLLLIVEFGPSVLGGVR